MKHIQYKPIAQNHIDIYGSNQFRDLLTSLNCLPKDNLHRGCRNAALYLINKVKLIKHKPVILSGHSLGGSIAEAMGDILTDRGCSVMVYPNGAFPVRYKKRKKLAGAVRIIDNDNVPYFFPWYSHSVPIHYEGERKWYKIIGQFFVWIFNPKKSDHMKY